MATRRGNIPEKDKEERITINRPAEGVSNIAPAVPASVIYKLLSFTFAMIVAPISTYFLTVNNVFKGNSTWAGASAAIMANVVLIGYIVAAVYEDQGEPAPPPLKGKKGE